MLLLMFVLIMVSFLQYLFSGDFTQSSRLLWFSLYSIMVPYIFYKVTENVSEFLWLIVISTFIQAILTINSFFIPSFKQFILSIIFVGGNQIELSAFRAIGFSSISGAAFSVVQSCGVFAGLFLLKKTDIKFQRILVYVFIAVVLLSTLIIGRTGLIISLLAILLFFISELSVKKIIRYFVIFFILYQVNYIKILESVTANIPGFNVDYFLGWTGEALTIKNNRTAEIIMDMPIPPVTLKTIVGTGEVFDINSGSNSSGHDSGYIQTYYSLGLIFAGVFYIGFLIFLISEIQKTRRHWLLLPVIMMFILEYKEPFIFKYILPFFVLSLILEEQKEDNMKQEINLQESA